MPIPSICTPRGLVLTGFLFVAPAFGAETSLTLEDAVAQAIAAEPAVVAADAEIAAIEARAVQAGLAPNPEVSAELQDAPGFGSHAGFRRAETTLSLSQRLELGGKRDARTRAIRFEREVALADREALRRTVAARTARAFVGVLGSQEKVRAAERRLAAAEQLVPALRRRADAGAAPPSDLGRGRMAVELARADLDRGRAELLGARKTLESQWNGATIGTVVTLGRLVPPTQVPRPLDDFIGALDRHPAVLRWEAARDQREAAIARERTAATPDVTVGVGVRHYAESSDMAVVLGASVPIPVYNRNQGAIEEARQQLLKTQGERQAARAELYRRLVEAHGRLMTSSVEVDRIDRSVLPAARRTLSELREAYERGSLGILNLLDAQAIVADAESRRVEALVAFNIAAAEVENLTGVPIFGRSR